MLIACYSRNFSFSVTIVDIHLTFRKVFRWEFRLNSFGGGVGVIFSEIAELFLPI